MRRTVPALVLAFLFACRPADTDADTADTGLSPANTDTDTAGVPIVPPAGPSLLSGREVYRAGACPVTGAAIPKDAIVQAWACNGPTCWPVPEFLSVERGQDEDVAIFDGCSGADRFELSWIAVAQ